MKFPFHVKPSHWWYYLNPFWWRRKRKIEAFLAYEWDNGLEAKTYDVITKAMLYGSGVIDWTEEK